MEFQIRKQDADFLSRVTDMGDWSVHNEVFKSYKKLCGTCINTVHTNKIAMQFNKNCERINSNYQRLGTKAVDGLIQVWYVKNSLVPLPCYLPKNIYKMVAEKGIGSLIIPEKNSYPY